MGLDISQFVSQAPQPTSYQPRGAWQTLLKSILDDKQAEEQRKLQEQVLQQKALQDAEANRLDQERNRLRGKELGRDEARLSLDRDRFGFDQTKFSTENERDDDERHQKTIEAFKQQFHDSDYQAADTAQQLRAAGYDVQMPEDAFARKKTEGGEPGPAINAADPAPATANQPAPKGAPSALEFDNPTDYFGALARAKTPGGAAGLPPTQTPARLALGEALPLPPGDSPQAPAPEGDIEADAKAVEALTQGAPDGGTGGGEQSNRVVIRDRKGNVVFERDVGEVREEQGARVAQAFAPFIQSSGDPVEKRAAEMGMQHALELVGTVPLNEAIEKGMAQYRFTVGEEGKTKRVPGAGGTGAKPIAAQKWEHTLAAGDSDEAWKIVKHYTGSGDMKALNNGLQALNQLETSVTQGSGIGDMNAVKQLIRTTEDRISDADMRIALGSGGLAEQLAAKFNYVANSGKLGDDYMAEVRSLAQAAKRAIVQRRNELAEEAASSIDGSPYPYIDRERSKAWVRSTLSGVGGGAPQPAKPGEQKPGASAPAAGGKAADRVKSKFGF